MKKKPASYKPHIAAPGTVAEPLQAYAAAALQQPIVKKMAPKLVKEFTFKEFRKIVEKSPFTLSIWADLLFISERTLQRYAKANSAFSGLHIERILQLEKLIDFGQDCFKENFNEWLHSTPFSLNGKTPFSLLESYEGIKTVYDLIGRIQHGILA